MVGKNLFMLGIAILFSSSLHADSEKITNPSNGHSYQRFDTAKSWYEAFKSCSNLDAHLATVTSESENNWIIQNLIGQHSVWLGGTDNGTAGNWQWITGESWDYNYWLQNQPDGENYLQHGIGESPAEGWNDWVSNGAIGYLCEWDDINPPVTHCVSNVQELHDALSNASSNYANDEIRVVQGTYMGNFVYASTQYHRLFILGGYVADCSNRVVDPSNTVLDGKQLNTVLAISIPDGADKLVIQGLTIKNGKRENGGGIYVVTRENINILIDHNLIIENRADNSGGGIYSDISAKFSNNTFTGNVAGGVGGAVYSGEYSSFVNNKFTSNTAGEGGGAVYANSDSTFVNNTIISNNTQGNGGGIHNRGNFGDSHSLFANNTIVGNNAHLGGGIYTAGYWAGYYQTTFTNNIIIHNSSSSGGGVCNQLWWASQIHSIFSNNIISSNSAENDGGGVYNETHDTVISNNTISMNTASQGAGILLNMIGDESIIPDLYNNLFWNNVINNQSGKGADLYVANDPDNDYIPSRFILLNNNFNHSQPGGIFFSIPLPTSSNLNNLEPLFVDADNGDLHLKSGSPMIDAGYLDTPDLPEFDIEGTPRVLGESVDIGAYEYDDGSDPRGILTVNKAGTGAGIITSYPTGINCGTDCAHAFEIDTNVMLIATPNANVVFDGWSGNDDCADGSLTMVSHKQCTATFSAARQLTINKTGEGNGTLTSNPIGINCGSSCSAWFYQDALVQLTAEADSYSVFSGWAGAADCTDGQVTMATDLTCSATFDQIYYTLMVLFPGTGSGTVTSSPAGIDCGTDCREDYAAGTCVTLTATAAQGSVFNGWAGACSGKSSSCEVEITDLTGVTANFTSLDTETTNTLYVTSTGGGTVTSAPTGITCGTQCDADFDSATVVTLTPNPNTGLSFNGWRGACSGNSPCQVPMTLDKAVMAAFGNTYPSQILLLQQEQLVDSGNFVAPRLVVLGPDLTIAAGSNITIEAGEQIKFLPGFKVEKNANFKASINPTLLP